MLGPGESMVALFGIACGTAIVITFINAVKSALTRPSPRGQDSILAEIKALREEIHRLRQEHHDVILALDGGMQRVDQRLTRVEEGLPQRAGSAGERAA